MVLSRIQCVITTHRHFLVLFTYHQNTAVMIAVDVALTPCIDLLFLMGIEVYFMINLIEIEKTNGNRVLFHDKLKIEMKKTDS